MSIIEEFTGLLEDNKEGAFEAYSLANLVSEATDLQQLHVVCGNTDLSLLLDKIKTLPFGTIKERLLERIASTVLHLPYRSQVELQFAIRQIELFFSLVNRRMDSISANVKPVEQIDLSKYVPKKDYEALLDRVRKIEESLKPKKKVGTYQEEA